MGTGTPADRTTVPLGRFHGDEPEERPPDTAQSKDPDEVPPGTFHGV